MLTLCPDIPVFTEYEALIKSGTVDAVIIATPHRFHADIAVCALKNGLHVLTEKPADITVSKARILNETAKKSGLTFGIVFNQRTDPLFARAREIVRGGQLGNLTRSVWIITNWYRTQHYYNSGGWRATWAGEGGGVLLNQAPHNLDLWQWICGMPVSLTAYCDIGKHHRIEVEDDATIFARWSGGATGTFITSTGEYPGTNRLEISGTRGKLVLENGLLKFWRLKTDEREFCFSSAESFPEIETEYIEFAANAPATAHAGILQNFTDAILNGTELLAPGTEGINELTLSCAAYLSSWCGNKQVDLPFDEELFDRLLAEHIAASVSEKKEVGQSEQKGYGERWSVRW